MRTLLTYFWPSFNLETHVPLTSISPNCYFLAAKKKVIVCPKPENEKAQSICPGTQSVSVCLRVLSSSPALFPQACLLMTARMNSLSGLWNGQRNVSRSEVCNIWVETFRASTQLLHSLFLLPQQEKVIDRWWLLPQPESPSEDSMQHSPHPNCDGHAQ